MQLLNNNPEHDMNQMKTLIEELAEDGSIRDGYAGQDASPQWVVDAPLAKHYTNAEATELGRELCGYPYKVA